MTRISAVTQGAWIFSTNILLLQITGLVSAEGPSNTKQLSAEAVELRRAGQDAEALPKFEEAYRLSPTPKAAAQLGLCLQALGRWSEADARLSEALKAKDDTWVRKNRDILKESLEQVKRNVARVEVYGTPEGAVVTVNGKAIGTYPLPSAAVVNAGNSTLKSANQASSPHTGR